jgi:hypothetical protein
MVQINLVSFPIYLKINKLQSFCRWFLLSQCVREFHPAGFNLRHLPQDDIVFVALTKYYTSTFLLISEKEQKTLDSKILLFKKYQQSCALITQILLNLSPDTYLTALRTFLYYR